MTIETDHYREAQRLLSEASFTNVYGDPCTRDGDLMTPPQHAALVQRAQVHATLALAETNTKATTTAAVQPSPLPDSHTELVTGLRALVDMIDCNPQAGEVARYAFDHINVPLSTADDPRDALQAMVTAALAHGATPSLVESGDFVGVELSWGARLSLHLYDRSERLGDVAALLPGGRNEAEVDA